MTARESDKNGKCICFRNKKGKIVYFTLGCGADENGLCDKFDIVSLNRDRLWCGIDADFLDFLARELPWEDVP